MVACKGLCLIRSGHGLALHLQATTIKFNPYLFLPEQVESVNLEKRTAEVFFFGTEQRAKCKMTSAVKDYALHKVRLGHRPGACVRLAARRPSDANRLHLP